MKNPIWIRAVTALVACSALLLCSGRSQTEVPKDLPGKSNRSSQEIIQEIVVTYGNAGDKAEERVKELLNELGTVDPLAKRKWKKIMGVWRSCGEDLIINEDVLPEGLPETDELCIVALGFELNPNGSMKPELIDIMDYQYQESGEVVYTPQLGNMSAEEYLQTDYFSGFDVPVAYTLFAKEGD